MKKLFNIPVVQATIALLAILAGGLMISQMAGQSTAVNLATQSQNPDFSAFSFTRPVTVGAALPAACKVGQLFFSTTAPAGSNLYGCTSGGTWTVLGGATIVGTPTSSPSGAALLGGVPVAATAPQNNQILVYYASSNSYLPTTIYTLQNGLGTAATGTTNLQVNVSMGVRAVTGTTDVLVPTDCGGLVTYNSPTSVAVAVPPPALTPTSFAAGCPITVRNYGAGGVVFQSLSVTIGNASSQTLNPNAGGLLVSDGSNWQLGAWN